MLVKNIGASRKDDVNWDSELNLRAGNYILEHHFNDIENLNNNQLVHHLVYTLAMEYANLNEPKLALRVLDVAKYKLQEMMRETEQDFPELSLGLVSAQAWSHLYTGKFELSKTYLKRALPLTKTTGEQFLEGATHHLLGRIEIESQSKHYFPSLNPQPSHVDPEMNIIENAIWELEKGHELQIDNPIFHWLWLARVYCLIKLRFDDGWNFLLKARNETLNLGVLKAECNVKLEIERFNILTASSLSTLNQSRIAVLDILSLLQQIQHPRIIADALLLLAYCDFLLLTEWRQSHRKLALEIVNATTLAMMIYPQKNHLVYRLADRLNKGTQTLLASDERDQHLSLLENEMQGCRFGTYYFNKKNFLSTNQPERNVHILYINEIISALNGKDEK